MQDVGRIVSRNAHVQGLQSGAHTGNRAMVVTALYVDGVIKATLPLGDVVGNVRNKIGIATFGLAHHAVFVIARIERGCPQPKRALIFISMATRNQFGYGFLDAPGGVERALQIVGVEGQAKRLQVQVLLIAQVSHGKAANVVQVVDVAIGRYRLSVRGANRLAGHEVIGNVHDVVAPIAIGGILGAIRRKAFGARLHANRKIVNLVAGVVVIKLAADFESGSVKHPADRIAQCGLAGVANMQGARRIGRNKLNQYAMILARRAAKAFTLPGNRIEHGRLGLVGQTKVDEPRPGNFSA